MRGARAFVGVLVVLTACTTKEEPRGWTRVVELEYDVTYYSFVHADREADVCVRVAFVDAGGTRVDHVAMRGGNYILDAFTAGPYDPSCTNTVFLWDYWDADGVTGEVEFKDFINPLDSHAPCTVSFDLQVEGIGGEIYEMSADDFPILDAGCPRPGLYTAEYTELDAAVGGYEGHDTIVISTWDAAREVCVWARLSADPALPSSDVEVPDAWVYSGLRLGMTEQADCVAEKLVRPPINPTYLSDSVGEWGSTGSVRFVDSDAAGWPCALDVDLDLRSLGRYDWSPDDVSMRAEGVSVVGACD